MAAGAQEQSSQTNEVSAAMEEMSRAVVETASSATAAAEASEYLNRLTVNLSTLIEQFEIEEDENTQDLLN